MKKPAGVLCLVLLSAVLYGFAASPAQAHWSAMTNPDNATLRGVWGSSGSSVYAVGDMGTILHYDGSSWTDMTDPIHSEGINGIWGSSATDIYAVGISNAAVRHYAGNWTISEFSPDLKAVWGSSASDIFAAGYNGSILHYDGFNWYDRTNYGLMNDINGIWGSSATNVYFAGAANASIRHYNGNWTVSEYDTGQTLNGIWGSSAVNIFAVGQFGAIWQFDGSTWIDSSPPGLYSDIFGVWGSSANDVYAVGSQNATIRHYDGTTWSVAEYGDRDLFAIWGSSCSDIFAVGDAGTIRHYDGEILTVHKDGTGSGTVESSNISGIDCGGTCSYHFCSGAEVKLIATAAVGSTFAGWSGAGCSGTDNCTVPALVSDNEVVATFTSNAPPTTTINATTTIASTTTVPGGITTTTVPPVTTTTISGTTTVPASTTTTTANPCSATRVLGADNPQLESLRAFRDSSLAKSAVGRRLISIYYQNDEAIASAIERSPALKALARRALETAARAGVK